MLWRGVKESFRRAPAIEKPLPALPALPSCQSYNMPKRPIENPKMFQRKLTEKQLAVLLAAGAGNTTHGLHTLINCYQILYNAGIKNDAELETFMARINNS
jgi:hypothetical protein